jgi:hypothetical protein
VTSLLEVQPVQVNGSAFLWMQTRAGSLAQRRCEVMTNLLVSFARHYLPAAHEPDSLLLGILDSRSAPPRIQEAVQRVCCS